MLLYNPLVLIARTSDRGEGDNKYPLRRKVNIKKAKENMKFVFSVNQTIAIYPQIV